MTQSSYAAAGGGRVVLAEADLIVLPNIATAGRPLLCMFHSSGGSVARSYMNNQADSPAQTAFVRGLSGRGRWPLIATDLGGVSPMGNALAMTRITQQRAYMIAAGLCSSGPMIVMGSSQGSTCALNYARSNPANVLAVVLILTAPDLEYVREQNVDSTIRGVIDTAYGVTYPALLPASYAFPDATIPANPYSSSLSSPVTGLPVGVQGSITAPVISYYVSDDTFTPLALQKEFVAALPKGTGVNLGALGHTDTAVGAIDLNALTAWLQSVGA